MLTVFYSNFRSF